MFFLEELVGGGNFKAEANHNKYLNSLPSLQHHRRPFTFTLIFIFFFLIDCWDLTLVVVVYFF